MTYSDVEFVSEAACGEVARAAVAVARRYVRERFAGRSGEGSVLRVRLGVDVSLEAEEFRIADNAVDGVEISAGSERGLPAGIGSFLRDCSFNPDGIAASAWRGSSRPECAVRGMYFATHFHNFYQDAPLDEVTRYVEELSLWGCNALMVWFDMHHYDSIDEPAATMMIARLHNVLRTAQRVGMSPGLLFLANEGYRTTTQDVRVTPGPYQYNVEICPSRPGGLDTITKLRGQVLDAFADIDLAYVCVWPHDQGGCGCESCNPWGARGFLDCVRVIAPLVRRRFPDAKMIVSSWCFDYFREGEFRGFWDALSKEPGLADYVMADAHSEFPRFVLDNPLPHGIALITFPEISMMGMVPWGGFGQNPLPQHIRRMWEPVRDLVSGGFPYSEGIFEDLNKVISLQLYWNRGRDIGDIISEYAKSEWPREYARELAETAMRIGAAGAMGFGGEMGKRLEEQLFIGDYGALDPVEPSSCDIPLYLLPAVDNSAENADVVRRADEHADKWVRNSWRWRTFKLRVLLEHELRLHGAKPSKRSDSMFNELIDIYHARGADRVVRPPDSSFTAALIGLAKRT